MRAGRGVGMVLALLLCACRSPEGGTSSAGELPSSYALTCAALVPTEVRDALPGFTVQQERPCPGCGPLCLFRSKEQPDVTISLAYDCRPRDARFDVQALLAPTLQAGGVEVPALGRAAARREPVPGMMQVVAWDDDTPCSLIVTWLGEGRDRAQDLARLALSALTHERLARSAAALELPAPLARESPSPDAGVP